MGKYADLLNKRSIISDKPNYYRPAFQSYMTSPEWRNVEISEDLGEFMQEGNSFFRYPYIQQIIQIWRVLFLAIHSARKHSSLYAILTSDYMTMDLFVAFFTTGEMLPKAFFSALLYPFLSKTNPTEMQGHLADYFSFYAKDIETKPFFDHDFKTHRAALAEKYRNCQHRSWTDWFTWTIVSADLWLKQHLSTMMHGTFHQEENIAPPTTEMIVRLDIDGAPDKAAIDQHFNQALTRANATFQASLRDHDMAASEEDDIHLIPGQLFAKDKNAEKPYTTVYARITAPRYMHFRLAIAALAHEGIHARKIAGQDHVQVKCKIVAPTERALQTAHDTLKQHACVPELYTYRDGIHNNREFCFFDVPVKNMHEVLNQLEQPLDGEATSRITFIHNF